MNLLYQCLIILCGLSVALPGFAEPRQLQRHASRPRYRLKILPLAEVSGINDEGQIVGIRYPKTPYQDEADIYSKADRSYIWENGTLHSLGPPTTHPRVLANALNSRGDGVGAEEEATNSEFPDTLGDAYLWGHHRKNRLPPLILHGAEADATFALSVNNRGVIVGSSGNAHVMGPADSDNWSHAVVWKHGKLTDLGWGEAKAINDQGQIAGTLTTFEDQFENHAALWNQGQVTVIGDGTANAINRWGQVVGTLDNGHAFLYDHGRMTDLGKCDGLAINDRRQVLLDGAWTEPYHAVYLWQKGKRDDINRFAPGFSHWSRLTVSGINNRGAIIGYGTYHDQERAFLLMPERASVHPKPRRKAPAKRREDNHVRH